MNSYRTQMRSIRAFFREEVQMKQQMLEQELTPADEGAEFQRVSAINDQWKLEIARIRDERLKEEKLSVPSTSNPD